jgi:hypothetical protein
MPEESLEARQAEMRSRMAKPTTSNAVIRSSLRHATVESNAIASSGPESRSHDAIKSDPVIITQPDRSVTGTRDDLYAFVWTEPMTKVAGRCGISANYLARVCDYLNVPYPGRGYWAKLSAGKAPKRQPLPMARAGEVLQWTKGEGVPRKSEAPIAPEAGTTGTPASGRTARHQLVALAKEFFEAGRLSEVGYRRPFKKHLVDIFVSRETLSYALDTANELFLAFEAHGHRVTLASTGEFRRPPLTVYDAQKVGYDSRETWSPGRETLVFIGSVAFGLSVYEDTEEVEVRYDSSRPIRYVRVSAVPKKRTRGWAGFDRAIRSTCRVGA